MGDMGGGGQKSQKRGDVICEIRLIQNPNLHFSNSEPEVISTFFFSCDVS